jgi:hypothetical protein
MFDEQALKEGAPMGILAKIGTRLRLVSCLLTCAIALPAWSDTLILRNGATFSGTLVQATTNTITFRTGDGRLHRYLVRDVDTVQFGDGPDGSNQNQPPNDRGDNRSYDNGPANSNGQNNGNVQNNGNQSDQGYDEARMERVVIPAGVIVAVRTNQRIDSGDASAGQTFSAQMEADVRDPNGSILIPRGADVTLITRQVENNGDITLDIDSITVGGRRYRVSTADQELQNNRDGVGANQRTGQYVGGGALFGAIIGAIAGGGKGAAIGAVAGGGAGAAAQTITRGKEVHVPAETVLQFQLDRPLRLHLWS